MGSPARPGRPSGPTTAVSSRLNPLTGDLSASSPDFSGFAKQQLGDLGTNTDGFDPIFSALLATIEQDTADLGGFDSVLSDLAFTEGDVAAAFFAPVDVLLSSFFSDGEQLNSDVQAPVQITVSPVVTSPGNPPGDTGGGGSTGGGGGGGSTPGSGGGQPTADPGAGGDLPGWDIPDPSGNPPTDFPGDGGGGAGTGDGTIIIFKPSHPVIL